MCEKQTIDTSTDLEEQLSVSAKPLQPVYLAVLSIILSCGGSVGGKPSKQLTDLYIVKQEQSNNHSVFVVQTASWCQYYLHYLYIHERNSCVQVSELRCAQQ